MDDSGFVFPLERWLERIGLAGRVPADADGLQRLHRAQALTVPFENLDIHLGHGISVALPDIAAKLLGPRGGYCYELNGLFLAGLEALGFRARPVLARVLWNRPAPGPRNHQLLLVEASGRIWVADVGFGGPGLRAPLPLATGRVDRQAGESFRLAERDGLGFVLQKEAGESWLDLYAFRPDEITLPDDITVANHFASTWPGSLFRQKRIVALVTERGRLSMVDDEFAETVDGVTARRIIPDRAVCLAVLAERFGIRLDGELA